MKCKSQRIFFFTESFLYDNDNNKNKLSFIIEFNKFYTIAQVNIF